MDASVKRRLSELLPGARFDEAMSLHTTFRICGPADCYFEAAGAAELSRALSAARELGLPWFMLGWGSNLLVRDRGLRGMTVRLRGEFEAVEFLPERRVRCGAGVRVPQLVALCAENGLAGTEPLVGVPGTVGGALVMNAGTREGEIGSLVREVSTLDFETFSPTLLGREHLRFSYRSSNLENRVILGCVLELQTGDKVDIMDRVRRNQQRRLQTQPIHTYNVGSVFKNPPGRFVAKLIEEAGLKGMSRGGARVSPLHANFIENSADAAARDVLELVGEIRERIRALHGLELELEMKVVGDA